MTEETHPLASLTDAALDALLKRKLRERNDEFLPGDAYIRKWGWKVDANGTAPTAP